MICHRYEDNCRNILGNKSYVLYNLDKVVQQSVKCLQAMSNDDLTSRLIGIFMYHRHINVAGGTCPTLYRLHVATCLRNTLEEVFRMQVTTWFSDSNFKLYLMFVILPQFITSRPHDDSSKSVVACQYLGNLSLAGEQTHLSSSQAKMMAPSVDLPEDIDEDSDGESNGSLQATNGHIND